MKDILIVGAMKIEVSEIKGAIYTGFGREKTGEVMNDILKNRRPELVISVGLVGAVVPELKAGDIFIPEIVMDYENLGKRYRISHSALSALGRIDRANGLLVTVPRVFKKEDKYDLKKILPSATAVDMETSAVSEVIEPLGIPFLCIKAVSDELDFDFKNKKLLNENIKKAVDSYGGYLNNLLKNLI